MVLKRATSSSPRRGRPTRLTPWIASTPWACAQRRFSLFWALTRSQKSRPGTAIRRCSIWPTSRWCPGQATTRRGSLRAFRPWPRAWHDQERSTDQDASERGFSSWQRIRRTCRRPTFDDACEPRWRSPDWSVAASNSISVSTRFIGTADRQPTHAPRQITCMAKTERRTTTSSRKRLTGEVAKAVRAALDKKAVDVVVLDLRHTPAFTDFFVLCSGHNQRQVKAIADAVEEALKAAKVRPAHVEGYDRAEWILMDYFSFIVHVFSPQTREFYSLERLWGDAERIDVSDEPDAGGSR